MHVIWYIFLHMTGIDTQQSRFYDFWSGFGACFAWLGGLFAVYRHKNCHVKGCWRLGHPDPLHGWPACKRHHSMGEVINAR
jgi:hypothetical protein